METMMMNLHCLSSHLAWTRNGSGSLTTHNDEFVSTPGEAVAVVQELFKTMIAKGYVLSKDALIKAKAFDESHQVSSSAAAKVVQMSKRIGLTDKIYTGIETVRSVDYRYRVSEMTRSAVSFTGNTAYAAANAVVNSSYFARGALLVSEVLDRAAKATAEMGKRGLESETTHISDDESGKE